MKRDPMISYAKPNWRLMLPGWVLFTIGVVLIVIGGFPRGFERPPFMIAGYTLLIVGFLLSEAGYYGIGEKQPNADE